VLCCCMCVQEEDDEIDGISKDAMMMMMINILFTDQHINDNQVCVCVSCLTLTNKVMWTNEWIRTSCVCIMWKVRQGVSEYFVLCVRRDEVVRYWCGVVSGWAISFG
jgi:hypothetical protein